VLGIRVDWRVPNTDRWEHMSQKQESTQLLERALRELSSRVEQLQSEYESTIKLIRESGLLQLAELYENLKNCSEEYTYVYNKQRKKYYYYYLKCKSGSVKSIYVGKSPEGYNRVKAAARLAHELIIQVEVLGKALRELVNQVENVKSNTTILGEALARIKR
jgi:hypothetical protein